MRAILDDVSQRGVTETARAAVLAGVSLRYRVEPRLVDWELPEGNVPESRVHDVAAKHLVSVLEAWAKDRDGILVARNLAVRWLQSAPRVGIDPDVCVLSPPPPNPERLDSLKLWVPGHLPPLVSFEIVSKNHPHKDYSDLHERYAGMGTLELVVFDPLLAGPKSLGGPVSLQLWQRDAFGVLERTHFGPGPVRSNVLDAWIFADGQRLGLSWDASGEQRWLSLEERALSAERHERAEKERERAEKERERAARLELERRVAELEAKSAKHPER